ncbi:kinase-like domain-containing protein [Parachaetomium inaequale]|uniref:EKC/KEOPS complex subunit BUD32 n=1 Tax=Parachaetomium inaequale TaxID=2588326 RepID=A0AAN6PPY0_9PEZI|nr:kinase-like domain-containing protein [Parachaetomium inaequale]
MAPRLRIPFASLSADDYISRGAAGHVFRISPNIVFKCPTQFTDPFPQQTEEMEESIKKIEAEKSVYHVLMKRPHPNIVQCILCVPEGIFLRGMESTLQERLFRSPTATVSPRTQERWVRQLTSAVAWLESLGLVHGDLRPANILLDANDDIKLGDFDATVSPGAELLVASEPFCKINEDFETPLAGPVSEQFSLASCIYTIRFKRWPWHDLKPRARGQRLARNEFPVTSADRLFGGVTRRCWLGEYASIAAVEQEVICRLGRTVAEGEAPKLQALIEDDAVLKLRAECEEFVAKQALGRMV